MTVACWTKTSVKGKSGWRIEDFARRVTVTVRYACAGFGLFLLYVRFEN